MEPHQRKAGALKQQWPRAALHNIPEIGAAGAVEGSDSSQTLLLESTQGAQPSSWAGSSTGTASGGEHVAATLDSAAAPAEVEIASEPSSGSLAQPPRRGSISGPLHPAAHAWHAAMLKDWRRDTRLRTLESRGWGKKPPSMSSTCVLRMVRRLPVCTLPCRMPARQMALAQLSLHRT